MKVDTAGMIYDADSAIDIIETAARQEHIASSPCVDFDDPEPAREAIREAFAARDRLRDTVEHYGRALAFAVSAALSGERVESMQDALYATLEQVDSEAESQHRA